MYETPPIQLQVQVRATIIVAFNKLRIYMFMVYIFFEIISL